MFKDFLKKNNDSYFFYLEEDQEKYSKYLDLCKYELDLNTDFISFKLDDEFNNIKGCKIVKNTIDKFLIIDLVLYFIKLNKMYLYKNNVYIKIKNSKISFEKKGLIKEILYDNFSENVVSFFLSKFKIHFNNFDFYYLIKNFLHLTENNILKIMEVSSNKIDLNFSILEFLDGIYSIKHNRFIPNEHLNNINKIENIKLATTKYYNKTFKHTKKPKK
jgi:hypothetical protein